MTACTRRWQVEAARDGRLTGKDLASAERHRGTCAECAEEERALAALGDSLARLPKPERNVLETRRMRQSLMSAFNASVLVAPRSKPRWRIAAALALTGTLFAAWWLVRSRPLRSALAPRVVDVHAESGARWSAHTDALVAIVDFADGSASFVVHPHAGRRVVVRLPDGELEDEGTVFELRVSEQRTQRVAVSEGKILVRLNGRVAFTLAAGEAWEPVPPAPPIKAPMNALGAHSADVRRSATPRARRVASAVAGTGAPAAIAVDSGAASSAEDDAYLKIVALLRENRAAQARDQAKRYLLRFPNGFRRIEVLNIAMSEGRAAPGD